MDLYPMISIRIIISSGSIEGRPVAVERLQLRSNAIQVEMAVNPAQQMVYRDVIIEAEVVKELRRNCLTSHHSPDPTNHSEE
ncbi:hypothetical protein FHX09_001448 [Rhizobium sp. BK538]|nr:hypothetical protein [Rhizobium sp. BK538]